jgi:hypothetical protein
MYNRACREFCEANTQHFEYVDVDNIVPLERSYRGLHMSRQGYLAIATHILDRAAMARKSDYAGIAGELATPRQHQVAAPA